MFQGQFDLDTAIAVEATAIPDVLFERGLYWASGRAGLVDLVAAHKWFNLAALKGHAEAIGLRREIADHRFVRHLLRLGVEVIGQRVVSRTPILATWFGASDTCM